MSGLRKSAGTRHPDVIVVGGGPAGATAARTLALAGARVQLLDRARFPRRKPCGGAVSVRALSRFPHVATSLDRISTHWLSRLHLESPSGDHVTIRSHAPAALMIRRIEFDGLLLSLAREAGADVIEGVEIAQACEQASSVVLHSRDDRSFAAPVVIAADGVNSVVARRLGLNHGWPADGVALDMMEEAPRDALRSTDPDTLWVAYGHGGSEGYAYVFPKATHVNVGIGYVLGYYRTKIAAHPWALQQAFTDDLCRRGVLEGRSERAYFTPFLLPVGGPLRRTASRRVMLAGDAGGFVNGITAEGIYYAMVTGELAARAAVASDTRLYERLWRAEVGAELRDAVLIQRHLMTRPERIDRLVAAARASPELADVLVRYAMGEVPYRVARHRLLLRSPVLVLQLAMQALRRRGASRAQAAGDARLREPMGTIQGG